MRTPELIERLTDDLQPMPRHAALRMLLIGLSIGAVIALVALLSLLGARRDLATALFTEPFWMKGLFVIAVTAIALSLCLRLVRPEGKPGVLPTLLVLPFLTLATLALIELVRTPAGARTTVWLGISALKCPWLITSLAIPVFIGVCWGFRQLAPTRPRLAGFSAGLLAGGAAAVVYCIHCTESAASFVATWYTAGMLLPALIGTLIGPRVLRW
jgi:hypothetical protein